MQKIPSFLMAGACLNIKEMTDPGFLGAERFKKKPRANLKIGKNFCPGGWPPVVKKGGVFDWSKQPWGLFESLKKTVLSPALKKILGKRAAGMASSPFMQFFGAHAREL